MDEDFLLENPVAHDLYFCFAERKPIIDYHCHLDPKVIAENKSFRSITDLWLSGDHYKWRAMRTNGVAEEFCTGKASDWEKFSKWAETVPYTLRNPLFHWTHLELKTAFGINELLSPETAPEIYERCNELLQLPEYTPRELMKRFRVEVVCTTDDPIDSLEYHRQIKESGFSVKVLPAWRPDKVLGVENPMAFRSYVERLSDVSNVSVSSFTDLVDALKRRHDFFHSNGCKLSDHGISEFYAEDYTEAQLGAIFNKVYGGKELTREENCVFKSAMLTILAEMDYERGWVQQYHYGPIRNNNSRMFRSVGADAGFDSIGEFNTASSMAKFLDRLDAKGKLAKTILYNLNPAANEMVGTMIGNFQDGSVPGKIQWGAGWWFMDQKMGIENHLNTLSALGLLSRFVGMLTDSRSFLSYPRHEYFRRILCNLIGSDVEKGELPDDRNLLGRMVEDICYNNAKNYFEF